MRWSRRLRAEVFRGFNDADTEIALPNAVHDRSRGGGRAAVRKPTGEGEPRAVSVRRQRMKKRRHARRDFVGGLEPVPAAQQMSRAFLVARRAVSSRYERERERAFRPLLPQGFDLLVDLFERR